MKRSLVGGIIVGIVAILIVILFIFHDSFFAPNFVLVYTGKTYPHNEESFTQGLFFDDDVLYETAGMYGESMIYSGVDLNTGRAEKAQAMDSQAFGEGSAIFKDKLYVLTWRENKVYIYNPESLVVEREISYEREGWGLTTDGEQLIASDGSSKLYFMDEDLNVKREVIVTDKDGKEVRNLNELEYIKGYIWANVWHTNNIVVIRPADGKIMKTFDLSYIYPKADRTEKSDEMNGIAYNKKTKKVYITGKYWPYYYEFELK